MAIEQKLSSEATIEKDAFLFSERYASELPFPHIVFDAFLNEPEIQCLAREFPDFAKEGWLHYRHLNAKLSAFPHRQLYSDSVQQIIEKLTSADFIQWLETLTGAQNLIPDPQLEGGGFVYAEHGGFLNMHADFTVHPHRQDWQRRVNLLIYLNEDWDAGYGGDLELWDASMQHCKKKISPLFNRCVIFNTDETSYHGYPDPLLCPLGTKRKNLALYYYTKSDKPLKVKATNYRGRPHDGFKKWGIFLDKKMLHLYDWMKRNFGIGDGFATKLMTFGAKTKAPAPKD